MYIISIKGFGDALIALWAINQFADRSKFRLVTASYIAPLIRHLNRQDDAIVLTKILSYPEIFNLRNSTLRKSVISAHLVRKEIIGNCTFKDRPFIFDDFGFRELLLKPIFAKYKAVSLIKAPNIYSGYLSVLGEFSEAKIYNSNTREVARNSLKDVVIFISSRVAKKCINLRLLMDIESCCISLKLNPTFIVHVNDIIDNIIYNAVRVQKYSSYDELDHFIENAKYIISSDSFPAHYAEYHGKKVFVVNNFSNNYYLPHSTFLNKWHSVGVDLAMLKKFLSSD